MTTRSILALLIEPETDDSVLHTAGMIAKDFSAHVAVTHVRERPRAIAAMGYEGIHAYVSHDLETEHIERANEIEAASRARFDAFVAANGFEIRTKAGHSDHPSVSWEAIDEFGPDVVARRGGAYDLIVVGRPLGGSSTLDLLSVESAIFATGRPVLVSPPTLPERIGEDRAGGLEPERPRGAGVPRRQGAAARTVEEGASVVGYHRGEAGPVGRGDQREPRLARDRGRDQGPCRRTTARSAKCCWPRRARSAPISW